MTTAEIASTLRSLVGALQVTPDRQASDEAHRLIDRLGLKHPLTMPAAIRIVSEETTLGQLKLIKDTAERMVWMLERK